MTDRDRLTLPVRPRAFLGEIGETYAESTADMPQPLAAPDGAPNVVVILLDDIGFGQTSAFGGPAHTPTIERLRNDGLSYNRFHTTALCSPTRAALLTGRNHHAAHTGTIMELATGFPGYDGQLQSDTATIASILGKNGYATGAFGKWHNTPDYELGPTGPFDRWPSGGIGFDYFFGFQGGEASQWDTPLYENTTPVEPPGTPGWHLSEAIADRCISWISSHRAASPNRPFFAYVAPGCGHAPHHVAPEWSEKYAGMFDHGWDEQRRIAHETQKQMGVVPADSELTPRPDSIPAWDDCSADERRLYARMQEVFAGFVEHCDVQMGRIIDAIEQMGVRDNTLIVYVVGDNGPSAEGSLTGTLNNMKSQHGYPDDVATMLEHIDEIGGPLHENHYPVGWCWAGSSPYQWMKQVASHFGGTRNPMVVSWPDRITDTGGLREQFHHVVDLVPTILDAAGLPEPTSVNGIEQKPFDGVSMMYTFDDPDAADRRTTQYFEMFGNRAIYHEGWVAGCLHGKLPWQTSGSATFDSDTWELYDITQDFSQARDLADEFPDKLEELKQRFYDEAAKNNVLPLDDRFAERADARLRPSPLEGVQSFVYYPGTKRIPEPVAPNTKNVDHTIGAEVVIPEGGAEGVLASCGGATGGWTLFVHENKLVWEHNWFGSDRYRIESDETLPAGHHVISAEVRVDDPTSPGTGGEVTLRLGEREIGSGRFDKQVAFRFTVNETFDVGCDTITPVSPLYAVPATFTGELQRVLIDVSGQQFDDLAAKVRIAMATQ